jgi:hypothetical protein
MTAHPTAADLVAAHRWLRQHTLAAPADMSDCQAHPIYGHLLRGKANRVARQRAERTPAPPVLRFDARAAAANNNA